MTTPPQPFRSVLVAIDLAGDPRALLQRAAALPLADDARVRLLHALPPESRNPLLQRDAAHELQELSQFALAAARAAGREVTVSQRVGFGLPHREILHQARTMGADLVVLGRPRARSLDGSPSTTILRRVLRHAGVPVLVVPQVESIAAQGVRKPRRLVAAVDLLDGSRNVVELARRARGPHAAPLTLVHVLRTPFDTWLRSIDEELARDAGERMESLSASLRDSTVSTRVRRGEARREILAEARNADLIVIGTRGRTALGAAILGGLSQDLAAVASCEVMIAPAQRRSFGAA